MILALKDLILEQELMIDSLTSVVIAALIVAWSSCPSEEAL